jgi:hypothetical protein
MGRKRAMPQIFISAVKRQQIIGSKSLLGRTQNLISERQGVTTGYSFDTEC